MAKKFIKRFLPDPKKILQSKHLQILGRHIQNPNLWHLNRSSVSSGLSVGIFVALMPIPFQMLTAAVLAVLFKANLPIAVALTWITNPLTTPPIVIFCYQIGSILMGDQPKHLKFQFTFEWFVAEFHRFGIPFLLGSVVVAIFAALLSNFLIRLYWRYSINKAWRQRRENRQEKAAAAEKKAKKTKKKKD